MKKARRVKGARPRKAGRKAPNPLISPLTPKLLRKELRASSRLQFRPLQRQLGAEKRASRNREAQIRGMYANLAAMAGAQQGATAADYTAAYDRAQELMKTAGSQDSGNVAALTAAEQASEKLRGANPSTSENNQRAAAAAAQRATASASLGGTIQLQGAAKSTYLRNQQRHAFHEGVAQRLLEGARRQSVNADLRELAQKRGDFAVDFRRQARGDEREYAIQKRAFKEDSADRRVDLAQSRMELKGDKSYNKALVKAAALGLKGKQASSFATIASSKNYSAAKRRMAKAIERQGKGGGGSSDSGGGGYSVREAAGLLRSSGKNFPTRQSAVDYLINRGVGQNAARQAVDRALSGSGGGGKKKGGGKKPSPNPTPDLW